MHINLSGHHLDVTAALRDYVGNKFERLERHFDHVTDADVVLSVEKLQQKAEATVRLPGARVFAYAVHEDMYAAIDALADKLDRKIRKEKEKRTDHHRTEGGARIEEA
jgi:putative sigma-54 modulation protein